MYIYCLRENPQKFLRIRCNPGKSSNFGDLVTIDWLFEIIELILLVTCAFYTILLAFVAGPFPLVL